jgi:Domain of Unknown Function (DUF1080)
MTLTRKLRRRDLCAAAILSARLTPAFGVQESDPSAGDFRPIFDGVSLTGWKPQPRKPGDANTGKWMVENGAILGGQDPVGSGMGAYLVSEEAFFNFELQLEARPDWPIDTGIYVRTVPAGNIGIQVLLDYRPLGGIGGYFGNGLGSFHAMEYGFIAEPGKDGNELRPERLIPVRPAEPTKHVPLEFSASPQVFLRAWKMNDWNQFRIRCVGELPRLTTWINGEKISDFEVAKVQPPDFDPQAIAKLVGKPGHIAFEVHNNDAFLGKLRWWPGALSRWRNIQIRNV